MNLGKLRDGESGGVVILWLMNAIPVMNRDRAEFIYAAHTAISENKCAGL